VRPCDVSGLHSEEAPHEEKESEPTLKERTGDREDETDVSEDLQDRPVGEEGLSGEPQIVRRFGISRASNRGTAEHHRTDPVASTVSTWLELFRAAAVTFSSSAI
jgi:hypothetical protein